MKHALSNELIPEEQEVSVDVLQEKYALSDEPTIDHVQRRVAKALSQAESEPEAWEGEFLDAMKKGFIPAGRIMSSAGVDVESTLINCFVQPVGDSVSEYRGGKPGIYPALCQAAETMRRGGGVGYNFSHIRPKGAIVKGTESEASGPVSYMHVFDRSCETVESAGARRGAQMGVLRIDHPDVGDFISAKNEKNALTNFNISVGVTDEFMRAVQNDHNFELTHKAEPNNDQKDQGAYQREDGVWVYRSIRARELWGKIMSSTYDHAEPGVLFIDRINAENNLYYCEEIEATNPCAEQPLPDYGACCLGSIDLTKFVKNPFQGNSMFDFPAFSKVVKTAIRMLDNVLDVTVWPLPEQKKEADEKRRIGLGFTGLGDALIMLNLRYDRKPAQHMAREIAEVLRDTSYEASSLLAQEKGAFPLFDADYYLESQFVQRLPQDIKDAIRDNGIRNSHVNSIAPTGTISLAFADNASNGVEPPFSFTYKRRKRLVNGGYREYDVEDHAYRLFRESGGNVDQLPDSFVNALQIKALDHAMMVIAIAPFIDTAISKTVNVPADYSYDKFKDLYLKSWQSGVKGLATFRPNNITGSVLSEGNAATDAAELDKDSHANSLMQIQKMPKPALNSLKWRSRPDSLGGNPAWSYMVRNLLGDEFNVFIGHLEGNGQHPFEIWISGAEQPRGLSALAKSLSMDMRSEDSAWLKTKLESLSTIKSNDDEAFDYPMPPNGEMKRVSCVVSCLAKLLLFRCDELGAFSKSGNTPLLDALISVKEPRTNTNGTLSWTMDIHNPATGDDFIMGLKELTLPDGQRRPYSIWLSGDYPHTLNGLCKSLSFDMRVIDPAWIGGKLKQLINYPEPLGDFLARVPGQDKQTNYPSTIAYIARLIIHRYVMLGLLNEKGEPTTKMGLVEKDEPADHKFSLIENSGRFCPFCETYGVFKTDGCTQCRNCGAIGNCE